VRFNEMEFHLPVDVQLKALAEIVAVIEKERPDVFFPIECRRIAPDDAWLSPFQGEPRGSIAVHAHYKDEFAFLYTLIEPIFRRYDGRPHWGKLHSVTGDQLAGALSALERLPEGAGQAGSRRPDAQSLPERPFRGVATGAQGLSGAPCGGFRPCPVGLTTYDAKDPDTKYPPIVPLRPPQGRAQRAGDPDRRRRLRRVQRVRRPLPHAEFRAAGAAGGLKYNRFHTTALCSPTRQAC
jgi:hypothetical protein